jgi:hypothetical protein
VADTTARTVEPVVRTVADTTARTVEPVVRTVADTTARTVAPVVQTAADAVASPAGHDPAARPRSFAVTSDASRADDSVVGGTVDKPEEAGPPSRGLSPVPRVEPALSVPGVVDPLRPVVRPHRAPAPSLHAGQRAVPVVAARRVTEPPSVPAVAAPVRSERTQAEAPAPRTHVAAPEAPPAATGGVSGAATGAPSPAPSGGSFALALAALSLAAALVFTLLLYPPPRWRPVFLVSLIERPG